jgi:cyclopropane-fatty-acyl-phospholipid synthase
MTVDAFRRLPDSRFPLVDRVAARALERVLRDLEGGTLAVRLPDGRETRFGAGPEVDLTIDDLGLLRRLALRPRLGLGESYQAGEWHSHELPALLELLARNAERAAARHPHLRAFAASRPRLNRRTGLLAARRNISAHYDLGNELFALFLDQTMTYSCAIFARADESLDDAQRRKLRRVCDKLELGPDDHVLEIGCGWGSFALTAAAEYGARVTGITLSIEQAEFARRRVTAAGLDELVEIRLQDFREVRGRFTKVASIEMLEAVGEQLLPVFFAVVDRVLAPGGSACIQTILIPDARYRRYRSTPDWIERHVFPGCLIPSLGAITRAAGNLELRDVEQIGVHYAETLARWRSGFLKSIEGARALGFDSCFERTWDFYFASCEALFRAGLLRDAQLVLAK